MSRKTKTTGTKEAGKPALVPVLRFPEFREMQKWDERALGSIASFASGGTPSKDNPKYWNGSIPWVSASSMYDLVVEKADHYVTPLAIGNGTRIAKKGSILILVRGSMLFRRVPICVAGVDVAFNQDVKALDVEASIETNFLLYQLSAFQAHLSINETGIGAGKIELDHLKDFKLFIPDRAEQQKIAECLSSMDEVIAAQARKVDALKTHKKGLMQQLFPREGETQPRLRFPEFQHGGEWVEMRFDQLVSFQSGGTPSKANPAFWNGCVPWVSAKDMKQLFLDDGEDHISAAAVNDGAKLVPSGTLLMLVRGMTLLKDVPICVVRREMSFNQDVKALRPNDGIDGLFLALLLTGSKDRLLEMVTVAGHGTGKLDTDELKAMALMLPGSDEQQRIADCLSSLDTLITAETQKLDALKTHKRGLMQQLFPSVAGASSSTGPHTQEQDAPATLP